MKLARHGGGGVATVRALASQVHPVFMLPPVATAVFGAILARDVTPSLAAVHVVTVFCALYTAHVKDGYVDFYRRGEDDDHPLTERGCRVALLMASSLFFCGALALGVVVGPGAFALALPGWLVGYFHAPQLDTNPVTATTGYPLGIGFALLGGYYVQTGRLSAVTVAFSVVFVVVLSGIKVVDDATDYEYDRSISKRTVAVALGRPRARRVADGLIATGLALVVALAAVSVFPPSAVFAVAAFVPIAAVARRADDRLATMLLVRGSYVFLAVLVVAVWFRPLA